MNRALIILTILMILSGCSGNKAVRVIERDKMVDIIADLYYIDQSVKKRSYSKKIADTTSFYQDLLERHGVTVKEYQISIEHYLQSPYILSEIYKDAIAELDIPANKLIDEININERAGYRGLTKRMFFPEEYRKVEDQPWSPFPDKIDWYHPKYPSWWEEAITPVVYVKLFEIEKPIEFKRKPKKIERIQDPRILREQELTLEL